MTAVFSWKKHGGLTLHEAWLWTGAVHYARRAGMRAVLVADPPARALLVDRLKLPFDEVLPLPFIPEEIEHVRDLTKLHALRLLLARGEAAIHVDFDVFFGQPLPAHLLAAAFCGEFWYATRPFLARVNDSLIVSRHQPPPLRCVAGGIMGGNDIAGILAVCDESIRIALLPENRPALCAANGYQASVLLGEAAFGAAFPTAAILLPRGNTCAEDYRARGYVHLAGNKASAMKMHHAAELVRRDFPQDFMEVFLRWSCEKQQACVAGTGRLLAR